ncbi:MAG: pyridoxamine 5'-phosphate oxidase [Puniceicoccaceae bacterium]|nr:pyridoxamine 5'-phosphate oxidase [Puniceicoccaceae bacterium]
MDLSDRRAEYAKNTLNNCDLAATPFEQFEHWFTEAESCAIEEPNAFCLATCDLQGQPSTRIVLLKEFSNKGLVFYTNYESRKATEFKNNPRVAANFLWLPLQRQVNIIGRLERLSEADSLRYFASRPQSSQIGAWTSPQSQVIASREVLEAKERQMKLKFADGKIPLPNNWGGCRIVPDSFEFWQGRPSRLHDRFCYRKNSEGHWETARLAP